MATGQLYGITGRRRKPGYVDAIEAKRAYLPQKKELADTEDYRGRVLALQEKSDAETLGLARDRLEAEKKADTKSSVIGLGNLGMTSYLGRKKNELLERAIAGDGGVPATGAVTPEFSDTEFTDGGMGFDTPADTGFMTGLKGGAKNWGPIAGSSLTGGMVGGDLSAKMFGDNTATRVIGGAVTAGGLGYLASGNPYTAGISALLGGIVGAFS